MKCYSSSCGCFWIVMCKVCRRLVLFILIQSNVYKYHYNM